MHTIIIEYHWSLHEELAEKVNKVVKALEMAIITILSILVCISVSVNSEIIASDLVRILFLLMSIVAVFAVIAVSFVMVEISERNEAVSERIAEFLITRKLVIGERGEID